MRYSNYSLRCIHWLTDYQHQLRFLLISYLCFFLSACSFLTIQEIKEPEDPRWQDHKKSLQNINNWFASGRFSARGNEETWSGHFQWQNEKSAYVVNISAPLSGGSFLLKGDDNHATLVYGEDKSVSGDDANALLFKYTGLKLPVNELRYWLIGLPDRDNKLGRIELDETGHLQRLFQQDWKIDYKRYSQHSSYTLPDKIFLENHEFDVRLSIQQWQIN